MPDNIPDNSKDQPELASIDAIDMGENTDLEGDFIPTTLQDDKMVKRNSVDNYKNDSAGVRETIANMVAAIMEAEDEGLIDEDEGEVKIELIRQDDKWKLVIQDNGIGMTRERLNVLSNMGDSTSAVYENRIGKYGIGFYAIFCLIELSGGLLLTTRSRKTNEAYFCRWKLDGGKILATNEDVPFDENEYGTKLELYLKDDLTGTEVDSWIREHAFSARRHVTYTKEKRSGELTTTEYPHINILEEYTDPRCEFSIDNEWFSAITSSNTEEKIFLLDISVEDQYQFSLPWNCAIRFHTEESTVIATEEHSVLDDNIPEDSIIGQKVLPSDQYDMISEERKDGYIPKRDLSINTVYTPSSAGTRDSLSESEQFMSWLESALQTKIQKHIDPILEKDIPYECTESEMLFLYRIIGDCSSEYQIRQKLGDYTTHDLWNTDLISKLGEYTEHNITVNEKSTNKLSEEDIASRYRYGNRKYTALGIHNFAKDNDIEIYMGVNINERKAKVANKLHDDVIFVKVSESDEYNLYEPLGWNKLKNINKSTIRDLDIPEQEQEDYEDILTTTSEPVTSDTQDKEITIRFGIGRRSNLKTISVNELQSKINKSKRIGRYYPRNVILFPDSESENVSDYYDIGGPETCVAKCSDDVVEYFEDEPAVKTYKEYLDEAKDTTITTNEGVMNGETLFEKANEYSIVLTTILDTSAYTMLDSEVYNDSAIKLAHQKCNSFIGRRFRKSDVLHILVTPNSERDIRPILQQLETGTELVTGDSINTNDKIPDWADSTKTIDTAKWTAIMKLAPLEGDEVDEIIKFFNNGNFFFKRGGETVINTLVKGLQSEE